MTVDTIISQKKAELRALPFYQRMITGDVTPVMYLRYLREMKYIHDYIDHKSVYKDYVDMYREMSIHVDILELVHDVYPVEIQTLGIGEDYAIFNMFKELERANAHAYVHYMEYLETADSLKGVVPGKGRIYTFEDKSDLIQYLNQNKPTDDWAEECGNAYDIRINILKELEKSV